MRRQGFRPYPLSRFTERQLLDGGDPNWPLITQWQREGFVRLEWGQGNAKQCWVVLTEKGTAELNRLSSLKDPEAKRRARYYPSDPEQDHVE